MKFSIGYYIILIYYIMLQRCVCGNIILLQGLNIGPLYLCSTCSTNAQLLRLMTESAAALEESNWGAFTTYGIFCARWQGILLFPAAPYMINLDVKLLTPGLQLWLDATDPLANGSLLVNGTPITTWHDKSGNLNNATGGVSPFYANNSIVFNGASFLDTNLRANPMFETIFVVFLLAAPLSGSFSMVGSNSQAGRGLRIYNNNLGYNVSGVGGYSNTDGGILRATTTLVCGTISGGPNNSVGTSFINGGKYISQSQIFTTYGEGTTRIGAGNGSDFFNGTISEVLIYNRALSTSERQRVEGYLAWKWRINNSLPSTHNYYNSFDVVVQEIAALTNLPTFITSVNLTSILTTGFTINWSGGNNTTYYTYIVDGAERIPLDDQGVLSGYARFGGFNPGTLHSVIIIAFNSAGSRSSSTFQVGTAPSQPVSLSETNPLLNGFTINWAPVIGATGYIYNLNGITTTPTSFTSTSATFSELEAGTLYRVIVTAVNTYASISSAIFIATTRPSQPTSLNLSNASASGFTINWLGSIGATSFTYSLNGNLAIPVSETSNSATFTGLSPGISYTFIVIANNSIIPFDSNASAPFIAITTPSQPTSLVASNIQTTGFTISWTGGIGATSYKYTLNGFSIIPSINRGVANKYAVFTGIPEDIPFVIVVNAVNISGSTFSNPLSITRPPTIPSSLVITNVTSSSFQVNWSGGLRATSYSYQLNGIKVIPSNDQGLTDKYAIFTGLSLGITYNVTIIASNVSGFIISNSILSSLTGLQLWLDGANPLGTGLLPSNGSVLPLWYDLSTNFYNATGVNSPRYTSSGISFNGSQYYTTNYTSYPSTESIFVVYRMNSVGNMSLVDTSDNGGRTFMSTVGNGPSLAKSPNVLLLYGLNPININTTNIAECFYNTSGISIYINGNLSSSNSTNPAFYAGTTYIGAENYVGTILEVIIFNSVLTIADRQKVEGYLAWKWGIQSALPIAHPYYNISPRGPVSVDTAPSQPSSLTLSSGSDTGFTINWIGGDGATSYAYAINGLPVTPSIDLGVSNKRASFNGLAIGTAYQIVITAINSSGSISSFSFTATTRPSQPRSLTVTNIKSNEFTVSWLGGEAATSYIYTLNGSPVIPSSDLGVASKTARIVGLTANTTYILYITAINISGSTTSGNQINPTSIPSIQTWLDGTDPLNTGVSGTNGFNLIIWYDKSGKANNMTFSGSSITYANNSVNSLNTIFANGNVSASLSIPINTFSKNYCGFIVLRNTTADSTPISIFDRRAGGQGVPFLQDSGGSYLVGSTSLGNPTEPISKGVGTTLVEVLLTTYETTGGTGNFNCFINGSPITFSGGTVTGLNAVDTAQSNISFAGPGLQSANMITNYCEVIMYNSNLSIGNRQLIEGYLAWKWGLQNKPLYTPNTYLYLTTNSTDTGITPQTVTNNNVTFGKNNYKTSARFNNSTSTYLSIPFPYGNGSFTISYWFTANPGTPFALSNSATGTSYGINADFLNGTQTCYLAFSGATLSLPAFSYTNGVGIWNHFALTVNATTGFCQMYGNGVPTTSGTGSGTLNNTAYLIIGKAGDNSRGFNGSVNNFAVYNSPLISSQILDIYNSQSLTNPLPSTHPYFSVPPLTGLSISTLPLAPSSFSLTDITATGFTVNWAVGTGAANYTFTLNGVSTVPSLLSQNSASFTGLSPGTAYSVLVTAINAAGLSITSAPYNTGTIPSKPNPLVATNINDIGFQVNWSGAIGATSYTYSLNGLAVTPLIDDGIDNKYAIFSDLIPNTAYTVIVTAVNSIGSSSSSQAMSPSSIAGLQLWLDGNDPLNTGLAGTNNASLTTWYDKSGKSRNMIWTGSSITYANSSINSLNTIYVNGTTLGTVNIPTGTFASNYCGFIVIKNTVAPFVLFSRTDTSAWGIFDYYAGRDIYVSTAVGNRTYIGHPVGSVGVEPNLRSFLGFPIMMDFGLTNYAATGSTGVFNKYYNGLAIPYEEGQTTGINGVDTLSSNIYFGGREGVSFNHTANYCEILLFNTNITTTNRQRLEGYLAWKWGLQSVRPYAAQTILLLNENTIDTGINSQTVTNNNVSIISLATNASKKNSASFTGSNYLSLPFNYGAGSFSITYWSYSLSTGPMTAWSLSSSATGASGAPGINADFTSGVQNFYLNFEGGTVNAGNWSSPATSLIWYQSILTVNSVTGECKSYLNGVLKNTVSGVGALQNTTNLLLGRNGTNTQGFNGYLNNFAVYNYPLTEAQITSIYNSESIVNLLPSSHPYYSSPPFSLLSVSTLAVKPESLSLINVTTTGFTVTWTGTTGITRFTYTLNDVTTLASSSTLVSATFTGLIPGTVYLIVVNSINARGRSTASDVFTGFTLPGQPTALSSSSISGTGFTISWTGGASATSYTYTLNGSSMVPSSETSSSASFTGLSGGITYAVIVTAINAFGSTASASFNVATSPGQPTSLNATSISSAGFTVNWSGANGATSYTYTIDGLTKVPTSSTSTSATFTGLLAGTSYAVIVRAVNLSGFTASSSFSVLTLPSVPYNVSQTAGSLTTITVSWFGGFGATSYTYTLNGSSVTPSDNQGLASKYAVFSGLTSGTTYSIVVTAVNSSGSVSSPPSVSNVSGQYLWIDGNDPLGSGTLPANNSTVSTLYDKSGNSRNLSVTSSPTPATFSTNSVNGMANLIFANSVYRSATLTGAVLFPFDVYIVLKLNSVTAAASICSICQSNSDSSYNALTFSLSKWSNASESSLRTPGTVASSSETSTSYILIQWSFGNSNFNIYRNGSQIAYTSGYTYTPPASLSFLLGLTVDTTTTGNFNGAIAEIVAYNTLQGTTNRQFIEGALAWKWGIQSSLSVVHPYYSSRPPGQFIYTAPTAPASLSQTAGSATGFTINWSGASGATRFIYTLNGINVTPASSTSTSATFTGLTIATSYAVIVIAYNGPVANTPSASFTAVTSPTAPYDIVVSNTSINAFTVSWSGGLTATSYTYTLNGSLVTPSIDNGVASKTARFTGLTAGTSYTLSIGAVNVAGSTAGNVSIITAPSAPTSLASSEITSTSFKISWSGGLAATSYSYTLNGSSVTPSVDNGLTSGTATFSGLTAGTSYTVLINAVNASGSSSGTLSISTPPGALTALASSEATTTSFKVSWTGGTGATSYTYTLNGVTTVPATNAGVASKFAIFTGLTAGTSYAVIVTATFSGASTSSSSLSTGTTPSAPTSLTASSVTSTGFTVSWSGGVSATSYTYSLNDTLVTPSVDNGVASRSATFTGLTGGTSYDVVINAINASGSTPSGIRVPSTSGFQLWLDSSGSSNFTFSSGVNVATWKDKSGKGYDAVPFIGISTYTTGTPGVYLNQTSLASPIPAGTFNSALFIFAVYKNTGDNANDALISRGQPGTWNGPLDQYDTTRFISNSSSYSSYHLYNTSMSVYNIGINFAGATVGNWSNGTEFSFVTQPTITANFDNSSAPLLIGTRGDQVTKFTGFFYEILVYNVAMSTAARQLIEGYLAWKWGLQTSLPVSHPHYIAAPVNVVTIATPPGALTALASSEATTTSFKVSWTGGTGATSYTYTLNGVTTVPATNAGVASKFAIFTGLTAGTSYAVIVTATFSGASTSSSPLNTVTLPSAPNTLTSSSVTSSGFIVNWLGGAGATSYSYTLNSSSVTPSVDNGVASRSVTFSGLTEGTLYTVIITATNASGSSSGTVSISTPPGVPTGLASSEITITSFKISWSGGQGATSYTYTLGGVTTVPSTDAGVASKYAIFTGLTTGQTYVVIVTAVLSGLTSSSSSLSVTTVPSKPYNVTVSNITSTGFRLAWFGGQGATSYRFTNNGQAISPSDSLAVSNKIATFSGLSNGTNYSILIYAVNDGGESLAMSAPTNISGLQTWLDGNDPLNTGSAGTNGSNLTSNRWYDKSGNGRNMIFSSSGSAVDTQLPSGVSYSNNSINSLNTVLLNNTVLQGSIAIPAGTFANNYVGFLVYKTINGKGYTYFGRTSEQGTGPLDVYGGDARYFSNSNGSQNFGGLGSKINAVNGNTTGLFNFTLTNYSSSGGTGVYNEYMNSTLINLTGGTTTGLNITDYPTQIYFVGRAGTNNTAYEYYCEILIYNTNISSNDRTLVEGYLAWKWGIESKLRSDHPYKSTAPIIPIVIRTLS